MFVQMLHRVLFVKQVMHLMMIINVKHVYLTAIIVSQLQHVRFVKSDSFQMKNHNVLLVIPRVKPVKDQVIIVHHVQLAPSK